MKNKILIFGLALCVFFVSVGNVWANEATFSDIKARYIELISDDNYSIDETDSNVKVSLTNPTYGEYSIDFNYSDNKITYVNNRDTSAANDETKYYYTLSDTYFISALIYSLLDVYDINDEAFSDDVDYDAMGIIFDTEDEVNYTMSDGSEISYSPINSFSVDLTMFDNYTASVQNSNRDKDTTVQIISFFKVFMDPMTVDLSHTDFQEDLGDLIDDILDDDSGLEDTDQVDDYQDSDSKVTQNVKVPATGVNSLYILIGAALTSLIIGILIYVIMIKKKI